MNSPEVIEGDSAPSGIVVVFFVFYLSLILPWKAFAFSSAAFESMEASPKVSLLFLKAAVGEIALIPGEAIFFVLISVGASF